MMPHLHIYSPPKEKFFFFPHKYASNNKIVNYKTVYMTMVDSHL